jgi:chromosome segregation protein
VYLRSIRLRGFKSFAKKTELLFEPGVAVVIGPNGSGKSNLSDAVMWALGEQSPTTMRGTSMQDVIFAGSDGRRAGGGAEVELTFDNSDGALPLPTKEVSVMRRVLRDGQSEYRVNHAVCRLTDVVELMSGVGLGKELHSIIGQGRVESFLASKPADRRALVEEAAGLGRYKRRRERALIKLRETQRNLERALDMERDVGSLLVPLRRQATAAEQLRAAERDRDEARGRVLAGEMGELDARLSALAKELGGLAAEREGMEAELVGLAQQRASEEDDYERALRERERRAQRALRLRTLTSRIEGCARLTEQRALLFDEVTRAGVGERDRLLADLKASPAAADDAWPAERDRLQAALKQAEAAHAATAERLGAARRALAERRAEAARLAAEREASQVRSARLSERTAALQADLNGLGRRMADLATEMETAGSAAEQSAAAQSAAEAALQAAASSVDEAAEAERDRAGELAAAEAARRELAGERAGAEAQAAHLSAAVAALQEVDEETATVAARFPGATGLAAALRCDEGYELALGAALAQHAGGMAVTAEADGWSLFEALREAGVRVARLLLPRAGAADGAEPVRVGGGDVLADHVSGAQGRVRSLLAATVVVDDLHSVSLDFDGLAVTRDGAYFRPADGALGLAAGVPAAVLLERRARLTALGRRATALRAEVAAAEQMCASARTAAEAAAARRTQCRREESAAESAVAAARRQSASTTTVLRDITATAEQAERQQRTLQAEVTAAADELRELEGRSAASLAGAEAVAGPLAEAEAVAMAAEQEHESSLASLARARVEQEERTAAAERGAREREAAAERARQGRERLAVLEQRLRAAPAAGEAARTLQESLTGLLDQARRLTQRLEADAGEASLPDRAGMRRLAEREAELHRAADGVAERRAAAQVEIARLDERRTEAAAAFEQVAALLEIAHFAPPADAAEAEELRRAVERAEKRMERIGPVNPLAEAECEELGERASFLREQRKDLQRSLSELGDLINELTARVDAGFTQTFAVVQEHFADMIATLFPGGQGSLTLVAGEDGEEAGVSMQVKPGRKIGKRLSMLSGGERSVAAIAFLMSLMLAHPSPFYILDEIEAALDDVNIGRFVGLLREYRDRTQFIIITHQKRTMEAADILYGVTMGADAASRVVSARMAEEEIDRQADRSGLRGRNAGADAAADATGVSGASVHPDASVGPDAVARFDDSAGPEANAQPEPEAGGD